MPISSDQPSHKHEEQCSRYVLDSQGGPARGLELLPNRAPLGREINECSANSENGDELPNCFLERSRLGCPLPCALRLRTQRSNHMAVAVLARWHGLTRAGV